MRWKVAAEAARRRGKRLYSKGVELDGWHERQKEIQLSMQHRCPICKTPTDSAVHAEFPFCSERCRVQDLGNWAAEKYVVSEPIFDEDDEELNEPPERSEQDDNKH